MDEYRVVMIPILKERQKSLANEINRKQPATFIECMEKTFSLKRMLFIFGTKVSKYTDEEVPEEYAEEAKKLKPEEEEED